MWESAARRIAVVVVAAFLAGGAGAATPDEARKLAEALHERFSWSAQPEPLALLVDADARVAFHKILPGRPLRASDPEWRAHYAGFHKDYADAFLRSVQPVAWSSPQADVPFVQRISRDLPSQDAAVVLEFLQSEECKALTADPEFRRTWIRLVTIVPRFQENELRVFLTVEELNELQRSAEALTAKYPHAFQMLAPFPYSKRPPAFKQFTSLWAQMAVPASSQADQAEFVRRLQTELQQVVAKWRPIVAAGEPLALGAGWTEATIMPRDLRAPQAPRFESFPVKASFDRAPAAVAMDSHPEARTWRTRLAEGARNGPNFAGHFTLVAWGCGTDCTQIAVVDARDGRVFFPRDLQTIHWVNVHDDVLKDGALRYRKDSTLVVAVGAPNEDAKQRGVSYYNWTGSSFVLMHRVPRRSD